MLASTSGSSAAARAAAAQQRRRHWPAAAAPAAAPRATTTTTSSSSSSSSTPTPTSSSSLPRLVCCRAERREYYDAKDMPPLPLTVERIAVPSLGVTVVDRATQQQRMASLAIFYDIYKDDQYAARLSRRSAITALCMYDRDDVAAARQEPGAFPNIDLLHRVYNEGLDVEFVVEEGGGGGGGGGGTGGR